MTSNVDMSDESIEFDDSDADKNYVRESASETDTEFDEPSTSKKCIVGKLQIFFYYKACHMRIFRSCCVKNVI